MRLKTLITGLLTVLIISSCTDQKSITEQLNLKEVSGLIEKDSLYESIIEEIEGIRGRLNNNLVLRSKFKDLSYSEYLAYKKATTDTTFEKGIIKQYDKEFNSMMDSLLDKYKEPIDNKLTSYRKQIDKYSPSSYLKVEFSSIDKDYYSSMNRVSDVYVKFQIIPLRGAIQGGSFRYDLIPKVTNKSIANAGCRFSHYTKNPTVYRWEANYDVEDEFENKTTALIKENYDFEYEILTVRVNDKTYSFDDIDVPYSYERCLNVDSLTRYDYSNILEEEYNIKSIRPLTLLVELTAQEKKKINTTAYELEELIDNTK